MNSRGINNMKDKLLKIINNYGVIPQLKYMQTEVFELSEAIINYENDEYTYIEKVDKDYKNHIAEELADVMVMLNQFKEYYKITNDDIKKVMIEKVNRQIDRIEKK